MTSFMPIQPVLNRLGPAKPIFFWISLNWFRLVLASSLFFVDLFHWFSYYVVRFTHFSSSSVDFLPGSTVFQLVQPWLASGSAGLRAYNWSSGPFSFFGRFGFRFSWFSLSQPSSDYLNLVQPTLPGLVHFSPSWVLAHMVHTSFSWFWWFWLMVRLSQCSVQWRPTF